MAEIKKQQMLPFPDKVFDPRILTDDASTRAVWNTESVSLAENGIKNGYRLKESPFIKTVKDARLRRAHLPFKYTEDELFIYEACMVDKLLFGNNFISLKDGDEGWKRIILRDYQENLLQDYANHKWNILLFPRQSGKTTTTVIEIVHFLTFNYDKDCVVIAQSEMVVNEILKKIKEAFSSLPFFMQPGFISFNAKGCVLENGCRLSIGIASESVVQGFSLDFLFIDEFAYIAASKVTKFWNNIYPALVNNPNSRCIIASTPNGRNKFYELWNGALEKTNRFKWSQIRWYDVPGRDEQFKKDTIANVGIEAWEMGFECSFDTQLKSIFNVRLQKDLRAQQRVNKNLWSIDNHILGMLYDMEFRAISDSYVSDDGVLVERIDYNVKTDYFTLTIDIAEGLEQDSSVLKLRKLCWNTELKILQYKSIGVFRSNTISVEDLAEKTLSFAKHFDQQKLKIIVENNQYGGEFFAYVDNLKLLKYEEFGMISSDIFALFERNTKGFERGIRWDKYNKKMGVKSLKDLVTRKVIDETHHQTIEEYLNFGKNKNDTYAAQYGHDDLVMVDVSLSWFIKVGNIFTAEFIKNAENQLRSDCNDIAQEVLDQIEKQQKEQLGLYQHNDWVMRSHAKKVEEREGGNGFMI